MCNITDEVCEGCAESLSEIEGEICYRCGVSLAACCCNKKPMFYESICAPYYYSGAPKKAVIHLKHTADRDIVQGLSKDMASCIKARYKDLEFDCCTFVPMHRDDLKKRGYNQSELLARELSRLTGIPCYDLLSKDFHTKSQHTLPEAERSGNVLGAISFNENTEFNIESTRILICDDIKTTGATLDECTKVLLFNGCAEVRCVTACITADIAN